MFIGVSVLVVRGRSDESRTKRTARFFLLNDAHLEKIWINEQKKFAFFGKSVAMYKDMDTAHVPPGERELY